MPPPLSLPPQTTYNDLGWCFPAVFDVYLLFFVELATPAFLGLVTIHCRLHHMYYVFSGTWRCTQHPSGRSRLCRSSARYAMASESLHGNCRRSRSKRWVLLATVWRGIGCKVQRDFQVWSNDFNGTDQVVRWKKEKKSWLKVWPVVSFEVMMLQWKTRFVRLAWILLTCYLLLCCFYCSCYRYRYY